MSDAKSCTCLAPVLLGKDPTLPADAQSGRWYGTRVSTVILVRNDGMVTFVERDIANLDEYGQAQKGTEERRIQFQAEAT